ncbi:class F sortase [Geodermatophilus sp. SYSU D00697]
MRSAAAVATLGLALAVGAPATWALTREPTATGRPVEQALPAPTPSVPPPASSAAAPAAPPPTGHEWSGIPVVTRDAAPTPATRPPEPTRLTVPGLGVDAPVDPVGVREDGQVHLPDDVDRVGWYRFGPLPGAEGVAVLAGHVDDRTQGLGALAPLREASPGDEIEVTDAAGAVTGWRVVSRELVEKRALPLDRLFSRTGRPSLALVTCGGPFLPELGSYRDVVVVVAEALP